MRVKELDNITLVSIPFDVATPVTLVETIDAITDQLEQHFETKTGEELVVECIACAIVLRLCLDAWLTVSEDYTLSEIPDERFH